jgi:hypothetical protein
MRGVERIYLYATVANSLLEYSYGYGYEDGDEDGDGFSCSCRDDYGDEDKDREGCFEGIENWQRTSMSIR